MKSVTDLIRNAIQAARASLNKEVPAATYGSFFGERLVDTASEETEVSIAKKQLQASEEISSLIKTQKSGSGIPDGFWDEITTRLKVIKSGAQALLSMHIQSEKE